MPKSLGRIAVLTPCLSYVATAASNSGSEHGLTQHAIEIARPFGFPITNSMVVTWIVAVGLMIFARIGDSGHETSPEGAQNLLEWLIASLYSFLEGMIGSHLVKRTFWFFATIFIFILATNWFGLLPGVGTIGWGHNTTDGFNIDQPLLRGANADLNLTLAMALVFFACWIGMGNSGSRAGRISQGVVRAQRRNRRPDEGVAGGSLLRRRVSGNHFDSVPASFTQLSSLWQRLRRREHAGSHVQAGSRVRVAATDSVLFLGAVGRISAGVSLHAVDCCIHFADLSARGTITCFHGWNRSMILAG